MRMRLKEGQKDLKASYCLAFSLSAHTFKLVLCCIGEDFIFEFCAVIILCFCRAKSSPLKLEEMTETEREKPQSLAQQSSGRFSVRGRV